ncbi:MAG: S-layer homology domain-containing protein, partial [bacterium]|nr:S-layer homology domain-containing protein [bacterium]
SNTEAPSYTEAPSTDEPTGTTAPVTLPIEAITENYTFIAEDVNTAAEIPAEFVSPDKKVYSPKGNSYSEKKGSSVINGRTVLNSSKVKGENQAFVINLAKSAVLTVYTNNDEEKGRFVALGSSMGAHDVAGSGVKDVGEKSVATKFENVGPGIVYISGFENGYSGADLFIGGFTVEFNGASETTAPTVTTAPSNTTEPTATSVPLDPDTQKAQADADALTLRSISDYAVYIDLDLAKKGDNGSTITWASSNEKYISVQEVSSNKSNYTGVVTRPTSDAECDETGGVPVTLTATVQYADAIVAKTFDVSVRKYNPIYYNDFQADVGEAADGNYKGIQDNVKAANGDTFRGIRVASFDNTKAMYGFEHEDHDVESYFDKRIMSTDDKYGKAPAPDGTEAEENFAFYYQHYNPYDGGTTYIPLWIRLEDKNNTSGYPEGLVIVSMDIYVIDGRQKFNIGIGTSKPAQMCRFLLNNGDQSSAGYEGAGVLRCFDEGNSWDYLDKSKYTIPKGKWVTATIVANSTTHLWDFYFDGMQIRKGLLFRNAEDFISTIEFTMDRSKNYSKGKYLIDNISVENITDDYNATYWDELELEAPYSSEKEAYVVSSPFRLYYNGTDGLAGQVYSWKSSDTSLLNAGSKSVAVDDLAKYGFSESEIKKYTDKGVKYVTIAVAEPVTENIPESGAYVTLKGSMEIGEKIYSKEFKIFVTKSSDSDLTDSDKALADLNAVTAVKNGMSITTEKSIDLPETGSLYLSAITWASSDSDVIDENGNVSLPKKAQKITLTATAVNGTATETKEFTINVKGKSSSSSGGGGGGSSSSGLSSVSRVIGTVSTPTEKFETDAYTPEQTSKLIFNDIENVSWAKEAIEALCERGVVSGYGNGLFAPNYSVTREQFVKMLVGALELDTNIASDISFSDVKADEWYAPYINAAAVLGVVSGKDDGSFGIGESITRQDMAVMCTRALKVAGKAPAESDASFNDSGSISDYAKAAVSSMAGAGYLTGDDNGNFNPLDTATRAQTAVVLYRIIK